MKLKDKIYLIQILILISFFLLFFSGFNAYISQKKKDLDANISNIVQTNKLFIEQYLKTVYKEHKTNEKLFKRIHNYALDEYTKKPTIELKELKKSIINHFNIDDFDVDIYIIDKEYTITKSTFKKDIGFNLSVIEDAKIYLDRTKKDGKIHLASNISVDMLDSNLNIYSYSKLIEDDFFELGFKLKSSLYKDLKENLFEAYKNSKNRIELYRITETSDKKEIYSNLFENKSNKDINNVEYEKSLKKFDKDKQTEDKHINAIRYNKTLKETSADKYIVYAPLLKKDKNELLFYNNLLMKIEIDISEYQRILNQTKQTFFMFGLVLIIFLATLYLLIKNSFYKPMIKITKVFEKEEKVNDKILLSKSDEFGILVKKYNKLYDSLNNEIKLNSNLLEENKRFIADTVHQIRTPLTNIMMNGEMVKKFQKDDSLSLFIDQIDASINMLSNSYEDLAYITSYDTLEYKAKKIDLSELLRKRVKFFSTISKVNYKSIVLKIEDEYDVFINEVECERLIDNNISNAIKYAHANKDIEIVLYVKDKKLHLEFKSFGEEIKDKNRVFEKNYRENEAKRGLGLGLNMVKGICEKNDISYEVSYVQKQNIFKYKFEISS